MPSNTSLNDILFYNIETVSSSPSYEELDDDYRFMWDKQSTEENTYLKKASLLAEFGKIICLSMGFFVVKDESITFRLKSLTGEEKTILEVFSKVCGEKFNKVAAFNGKRFEFPYICRRLLINNIKIPFILDISGKKPWEVMNIDSLDMWKFGDNSYTSLQLICKCLNISVDNKIDGSQIHDIYYKEKDINKIAEHCNTNLIADVTVFLKLSHYDINSFEIIGK